MSAVLITLLSLVVLISSSAFAQDKLLFSIDTSRDRVVLWNNFDELRAEILEIQQLRGSNFFCSENLINCSQGKCSADITNCLLPRYRNNLNRSFFAQGPNCFSTALHLTGHYPTLRGVDEGEFRAFTNLACEKVDSPRPGDLGVFENPNSLQFTHVYVYLSDKLGMDKPGVDYLGPTPIRISSRENIFFRALASPECRHYAPDPSVCSNTHYFLRCQANPAVLSAQAETHNNDVLALEELMQRFLTQKSLHPDSNLHFEEMQRLYHVATESLNAASPSLEPALIRLYSHRLESLKDQIRFIQIKISVSQY